MKKRTRFLIFTGMLAAISFWLFHHPIVTKGEAEGNLNCFEPQVADAGFKVHFQAEDQAELTENNFAGEISRGILDCGRTDSNDDPSAPLKCVDPRVMDSGYKILLKNPDNHGVQNAEVFEIKFTGEKKLATLICKRD